MELEDIKKIDFEDGKKRVLIIGNGKSRLNYTDIPLYWKVEVWGCNWIYKDYLNGDLPRLDALIGDYICLKEAVKNDKIIKDVQIYGKSTKSIDLRPSIKYPNVRQHYSDSGSTFVLHALHEGYDEIYLLGFDLGGPDIYQYRHHLKNKKTWVRNWRMIAANEGLDKIHFIGFNHKPMIYSEKPDNYYAQFYLRGRDHLEGYYSDDSVDPVYIETIRNQVNNKKSNQVLILGNGKSRMASDVKRFINQFQGEIWGCNEIYNEHKTLPRLDRVGVQNSNLMMTILEYLHENNIEDQIKVYINKVINDFPYNLYIFQDNRNFLTGQRLILQAIYEQYDRIYLAGFDFGGVDVYNRKMLQYKRAQEEMKQIIQENGLQRFHFIKGIPKFIL